MKRVNKNKSYFNKRRWYKYGSLKEEIMYGYMFPYEAKEGHNKCLKLKQVFHPPADWLQSQIGKHKDLLIELNNYISLIQ